PRGGDTQQGDRLRPAEAFLPVPLETVSADEHPIESVGFRDALGVRRREAVLPDALLELGSGDGPILGRYEAPPPEPPGKAIHTPQSSVQPSRHLLPGPSRARSGHPGRDTSDEFASKPARVARVAADRGAQRGEHRLDDLGPVDESPIPDATRT